MRLLHSIATTLPLLAGACDAHVASRGPAAPVPSQAPALAYDTRLRATPDQDVTCSASRDLPAAAADFDGDGRPERVAARVRDGSLVVTRHEMPGLVEVARHSFPDLFVTVGSTRCTADLGGDAWIYQAFPAERRDQRPRFELYAFRAHEPSPAWATESNVRPNLRLDLDGDGHVDPILGDGRVVRGGVLSDAPWSADAGQLHGARAAFGCEAAVDLDGDGDRDLVADTPDGLRVVELPSLRTVARWQGQVSRTSVVRWGDRWWVHTFVGAEAGRESGHLFEVRDGALREVRGWSDGTQPRDDLDPAGDGSLLAVERPWATELLSVGDAPAVHLDVILARAADSGVVRLGPVRVDRNVRPDLVGIRYTAFADPALGLSGVTRYDIVLRGPGGAGPERVVWQGEIAGEGSASASLVDLHRDGYHEIVVHERWVEAHPPPRNGGRRHSRWIILDGEGGGLWQDGPRSTDFGDERYNDDEASARVLDIAGDGTLALRFRSSRREWYVLPVIANAPATIPPCLE